MSKVIPPAERAALSALVLRDGDLAVAQECALSRTAVLRAAIGLPVHAGTHLALGPAIARAAAEGGRREAP